METTYSKCEDHVIPNSTVTDEKKYIIGKYGSLRRTFLKEHHHSFYTVLMMNGTLLSHLKEIDETCHSYMENMVSKMAWQEGVTESLKAADQMEWVRRMNSIHNRAEEFVLK